mmetsp:Transcript_54381/g.79370  ORF Transcript_54381/g.79370 Transcript_54381/m.79370 type:complete len:129 (+) Transcript_54381:130-516(+)
MKSRIRQKIIQQYEVGMSRSILEAGYSIATLPTTNGFQNYAISASDINGTRHRDCRYAWAYGTGKQPTGLPFFKTTTLGGAPAHFARGFAFAEKYHSFFFSEQHFRLDNICGYDDQNEYEFQLSYHSK